MSNYPQLRTCPPWCREDHRDQQVWHGRNVAGIPRAHGDLDVEVNLMQDPLGTFVRIGLTDYGIPDGPWAGERNTFTRVPLDVAGTWAYIATNMDARGAMEVGEALEQAHEIFREERNCTYPWCIVDHREADHDTHHRSDEVKVANLAMIRYINVKPDDEEDEAFVRVFFKSPNGVEVSHEFNPGEAVDIADMLSAMEVGEVDDLMAVLRAAGRDLGAPR